MDFAGVLSHRAQLKAEKRHSEGPDAALAALQNNLALHKQEKQAKAVNISSSIIAAPENRFKAAQEQKRAQRRGLLGSQPASPALSATPRLGAAPTSTPATDSAVRARAMRTPLIHLLAMKPLTREEITQKTRIPREDLEEVLPKIGKERDGKWELTDRACKDLDVYKFGYSSKEDRQAAIDNAIRAYDRMRLGKDEKIWQMLLPREERGKGVVLSKLHLGAGAAGRGLTPSYAASPMLGGDAPAEKGGASASNTPRLGPSSTPKPNSGALSKTLFAKDPKKARAAEEAKERKRKDREAAASTSDREGGKPVRKKQTTKTNNPKVKSAELVHSSDEDSVSSGAKETSASSGRLPKPPPNERKPLTNAPSATKTKSAATAHSTSTATAKATKPKTTISKPTSTSAKPSPSLSSTVKVTKPASIGRNTPSSSQGRSQLSPQNRSSRPNVPSPLGAARPRNTSDVETSGAHRVRPGAETPKGLGITNGFRKRQDTVTSTESNGEPRKANGNGIRKPTANGTNLSKAPMTNGNTTTGLKRKAVDEPPKSQNATPVANKHRKSESNSSQSQKSHSSSVGAASSVENDGGRDRSDSGSSITDTITYRQGVNIARQFRDVYYPQYAKVYDEQAAMEKRGEIVSREERQHLWQLHRRCEQMKREIKAASLREDED